MFLWPDPAGCPAPGFPRHRALWSADFPPRRNSPERSPDQPGLVIIPLRSWFIQSGPAIAIPPVERYNQ